MNEQPTNGEAPKQAKKRAKKVVVLHTESFEYLRQNGRYFTDYLIAFFKDNRAYLQDLERMQTVITTYGYKTQIFYKKSLNFLKEIMVGTLEQTLCNLVEIAQKIGLKRDLLVSEYEYPKKPIQERSFCILVGGVWDVVKAKTLAVARVHFKEKYPNEKSLKVWLYVGSRLKRYSKFMNTPNELKDLVESLKI